MTHEELKIEIKKQMPNYLEFESYFGGSIIVADGVTDFYISVKNYNKVLRIKVSVLIDGSFSGWDLIVTPGETRNYVAVGFEKCPYNENKNGNFIWDTLKGGSEGLETNLGLIRFIILFEEPQGSWSDLRKVYKKPPQKKEKK